MTRKERYEKVIDWFSRNMPAPETELRYRDPYQLLVAVILSAQCTDKRVNLTTPAFFERFPDVYRLAKATPEEIYPYIRSISYPNNKARNLAGMARTLLTEFGGTVPDTIDELQRLPGVGRKTANVVASVVFHREVMAVDTHVFRVSRRIGLTEGARTPLQTELQLTEGIPSELLPRAHHWLILHGRYVCTARKPRCGECGIRLWCKSAPAPGIDTLADETSPVSRRRPRLTLVTADRTVKHPVDQERTQVTSTGPRKTPHRAAAVTVPQEKK